MPEALLSVPNFTVNTPGSFGRGDTVEETHELDYCGRAWTLSSLELWMLCDFWIFVHVKGPPKHLFSISSI